VRGLARDEKGAAVTALLLLLVPLLLAGIVLSVETPRFLRAADPDVGDAVVQAVRAAAMCVDGASQANGDPRIDPDRAHEVFRRILARNLCLSEATLEPLSGSALASVPVYELVVFNGENPFVPAGRAYPGGEHLTGNLPLAFWVGDLYVTPGGVGTEIVLDAPGCVAVVKATVLPVFGSRGSEVVRWASAKVVRR